MNSKKDFKLEQEKAFKQRKNYYHHYLYKKIPSKFLLGKILEIGSGNGITQLCSKNAERFFSDDYLGIDFLISHSPLNIINKDILNFDFFSYEYTSFLAVAVLEHIDFYHWEKLFQTISNTINKNGYIIIIVPYKERLETFYSSTFPKAIEQLDEYKKYVGHRVFYITKKIFIKMLGKPIYTKKIRQTIHFREEGESFLWAILRFIKRFFTFHPYVWNYFLAKNRCLLFIYQKK